MSSGHSGHQLSGAFTIQVDVDRLAQLLSDRLAARIIDAFEAWDLTPAAEQAAGVRRAARDALASDPQAATAVLGSDVYERTGDVPAPRVATDSDPGMYPVGRHGRTRGESGQ